MSLKGTLVWLCSLAGNLSLYVFHLVCCVTCEVGYNTQNVCLLAVWSSSAAQDESIPHNCSSQAGNLPAALKVNYSSYQKNDFIVHLL